MTKKNDDLFPLFKELFDAITVGHNNDPIKSVPDADYSLQYGRCAQGWYTVPQELLANAVEKCLSHYKYIGDNFSYTATREKIFTELRNIKFQQKQFSEKHYQEIISYFKSFNGEEFEVFVPIYGLEVTSEDPVEIGEFTVYGKSHYSILQDKWANDELHKQINSCIVKKDYVSYKVTACDPHKAYEKASIFLEKLENIFKLFCYPVGKHQDVGIFNYNFSHERNYIAFANEDHWGIGDFSEGVELTVKISNFLENSLFSKIIEKLFSKSLSEMEKRLMNAIDLCGRASCEKQPYLGFLFCMFGLEALLQAREGEFVSASITAQMTDAYAFIVCKDYDERKKCAKDFQDMYAKRCKIAHGNGKDISEKDYKLALKYLHALIPVFLEDETISKIEKMEAFKNHVQDRKFQKTVR